MLDIVRQLLAERAGRAQAARKIEHLASGYFNSASLSEQPIARLQEAGGGTPNARAYAGRWFDEGYRDATAGRTRSLGRQMPLTAPSLVASIVANLERFDRKWWCEKRPVEMKRMQEKDIPAFVRDVVATGCDICAVGPSFYSLGDTDVPRDKRKGLHKKLGEIDARYGSRDHLRYQIAAHLRSIGRYIDAPPMEDEDWIDNEAPELAGVTPYDVAHFPTYVVLLMAQDKGIDWRKVARATLNIDPERQPERARRVWASHLARARWLATSGCDRLRSDLLQ